MISFNSSDKIRNKQIGLSFFAIIDVYKFSHRCEAATTDLGNIKILNEEVFEDGIWVWVLGNTHPSTHIQTTPLETHTH